MENENQQKPMPVNTEEVALIKSAFKNNEILLQGMRALFLGLGATQQQKDIVRSAFKNEKLLKLVRRRFLPSLEADSPIGVIQDVWLGAESMVFAQTKDTIKQTISHKREAIVMVEHGFTLLSNPDGKVLSMVYDAEIEDELGIRLLSRNMFIRLVETQLMHIKTISELKDETPEQIQERQTKDSSK